MFDYFVRWCDVTWFLSPQRPSPPLYKRISGSNLEPVSDSPIGDVHADCELIELTREQFEILRAA